MEVDPSAVAGLPVAVRESGARPPVANGSSSARKQLARTARHYLDLSPGIDSSEIIDTVHSRPAPVIAATAGLGSMF
jgi:hypothetical protein